MRRRKSSLLILTAIALIAALSLTVSSGISFAKTYPGLDEMKPVTIKFNTYMSSKHAAYLTLTPFFKKIEAASKGKIKFKVYAGGLLLKAKESLRGLSQGTCDAALITTTYFSSFLPKINLLGDVLLLTDDATAASGAATEMLLLRPQFFKEELAKNNIIMLGGFYATNPYMTMSNKPIQTYDELKGKKIRAAGAAWVRLAKSLGVTAVTLPISETYEALQRGTIEGVWGTAEFLRSYSLWDVAKYVTTYPTGCYCGSCAMTFNLKFWKKLPKPAKDLLLDHMASVPAGITLVSYGAREEETIKNAPKHGVKFIKPESSFVAKMDEFKKGILERASKWAHDKRGLDEEFAKAVIKDYIKTYAKWKKLSQNVVKKDLGKFKEVLTAEVYQKLKD